MTEREACERIVADGDCVRVLCDNCPLFKGEWDCTDMDEVTLAELWLRLHPTEKKLVFSAEKFYADEEVSLKNKYRSMLTGWPERADGKTEAELSGTLLAVYPEWMEER